MMRLSFAAIAALAVTFVSAVPSSLSPRSGSSTTWWNGQKYKCKTYPEDDKWPSPWAWWALNYTVDGNLQVHIPPGAPCYDTFDGALGSIPTYDAAQCEEIQSLFFDEQWTTDQPGAGMWTYFTNDTCRPDVLSDQCTQGGYGVYVIEATERSHIKYGIKFAAAYNLRLVIRNTGHDFIGRSVGWNSLIINTHSFKDIEFSDSWDGPGDYSGPVVKIGAGVQGGELLAAAHAQPTPLSVVVGECATVGVAGGFVQGGGHGPMTTLNGFAADNALEFEAITADGDYVTANAKKNSDLFWALKGGGPGNYAVVTSVVLKTYEDQISAGIILEVNETMTTDYDLYWDAVTSFHKYSNHFVDNGLYVYFEIGGPFGGRRLHIRPFVGIGKTAEELEAVVEPFITELDDMGCPYDKSVKEFDSLYELYIDMFEAEYAGSTALTGGWMFTHQDVEENNDGIIEAFKTVTSPREDLTEVGWMVGHLWDAGHGVPESNSATHPKFRNATDFVISILPVPVPSTWEEKMDLQDVLTNTMDAALRAAGPNGATYVNEADPYQDDWQEHFYGDIYDELAELKKKWDPDMVFWSVSLPGTEDWEVIDYWRKLCKKV